jgi:hypothetical protein
VVLLPDVFILGDDHGGDGPRHSAHVRTGPQRPLGATSSHDCSVVVFLLFYLYIRRFVCVRLLGSRETLFASSVILCI